jgi:hypothetical protein
MHSFLVSPGANGNDKESAIDTDTRRRHWVWDKRDAMGTPLLAGWHSGYFLVRILRKVAFPPLLSSLLFFSVNASLRAK